MSFTPFIQLDDFRRGLCFDLKRVWSQFDMRRMGAKLGDGARVALLPRYGKFKAVDPGETLATIGILGPSEALERHIVVQQQHI